MGGDDGVPLRPAPNGDLLLPVCFGRTPSLPPACASRGTRSHRRCVKPRRARSGARWARRAQRADGSAGAHRGGAPQRGLDTGVRPTATEVCRSGHALALCTCLHGTNPHLSSGEHPEDQFGRAHPLFHADLHEAHRARATNTLKQVAAVHDRPLDSGRLAVARCASGAGHCGEPGRLAMAGRSAAVDAQATTGRPQPALRLVLLGSLRSNLPTTRRAAGPESPTLRPLRHARLHLSAPVYRPGGSTAGHAGRCSRRHGTSDGAPAASSDRRAMRTVNGTSAEQLLSRPAEGGRAGQATRRSSVFSICSAWSSNLRKRPTKKAYSE